MSMSFYKFMSDSDEGIEDFLAKCAQMSESAFLVSDSKIAAILKTIAGNSKLFELFLSCARDFSFELVFEKSKSADKRGNAALKPPKTKKEFVSFVLALLLKFDTREIDLHFFLTTYYFSEDGVNESYSMFCKDLIEDFAKASAELYSEKYFEVGVKEQKEAEVVSTFEEEEEFELSSNSMRIILEEISRLVEFVSKQPSLNSAERKELLTVIEGLGKTINTRSKNLIVIMWIGCKNTLHKYGFDNQASKTEKLLKKLNIIDTIEK